MNVLPVWSLTSFVFLHLGALACAWCTRVSAGSRFELCFQYLFLLALSAVGIATWYGHSVDFGRGIPSGITLISMVLLAVTDFRRYHEPVQPNSLAMYR